MDNIFALKVGDRENPSAVKVILDGKHYLKHENIDEIYEAALDYKAAPEDEKLERLNNLLDPYHRETVLGEEIERDNMGNYYLEGTDVPIPQDLISTIKDLEEQGAPIEPLTKFWKHCLLNPNTEARDDFFQYCRDYGVTITDEGYAVLYKSVEKNPYGDIPEDLVTFIGTEFLRVKRSGADPADYYVVEDDGEYGLVDSKDATSLDAQGSNGQMVDPDSFDLSFLALMRVADQEGIISSFRIEDEDKAYFEYPAGSYRTYHARKAGDLPFPEVQDLFDDLDEALTRIQSTELTYHGTLEEMYEGVSNSSDAPYRPHHKGGDYGNEIRLGEWTPMPRERCDPSRNKSCSKGLHVGSYSYVDRFSRPDSEILAAIVSPRDIVALPKSDHSKIRTCKYYPYAVMERDTDDGSWEEIDSVHISEDFVEDEENLQEQLEGLSAQDTLTEEEESRKEILEERLQEVR